MDRYWSLSDKKVRFQQSFISWVLTNHSEEKTVILGGGSKGDPHACLMITNGVVKNVLALASSQEEADDRIMAHINYVLKQNVSHVTVVSSDTDILASLLYHAVRWINNYNLKTLWNVRGTSSNRQVVPVHILLQDVGEKLALILPALHSLTGCDSISKVGTKSAALKCVPEHGYLIADFGKSELTEDIVKRAENFLINCIKPVTSTSRTFDQLRFNQYFDIKSKKVDLSHVPCTSSTLRLHIQRAYHQCKLSM